MRVFGAEDRLEGGEAGGAASRPPIQIAAATLDVPYRRVDVANEERLFGLYGGKLAD